MKKPEEFKGPRRHWIPTGTIVFMLALSASMLFIASMTQITTDEDCTLPIAAFSISVVAKLVLLGIRI